MALQGITNCAANMGMGPLADKATIFKRKFRWGMSIKSCGGLIPEYLVKVAARPNLSVEETEINMKHGKMYIPGKASWETITVTLYDVVGPQVKADIGALYSWILSVYDFSKGIQNGLCMGSAIQDYAGVVTLNMYSGCGTVLEVWTLADAWPQAINWNDLDYSSSEEATIELTLRYANVSYDSNCMTNTGCTCSTC